MAKKTAGDVDGTKAEEPKKGAAAALPRKPGPEPKRFGGKLPRPPAPKIMNRGSNRGR